MTSEVVEHVESSLVISILGEKQEEISGVLG